MWHHNRYHTFTKANKEINLTKSVTVPTIKSSFLVAAITVAATVMISGSASATSMPIESQNQASSHTTTTQVNEPRTEEQEKKHQEQVKLDEIKRDQAEKKYQLQVKQDEVMRNEVEALYQAQVKQDEIKRNQAEAKHQESIKHGENNKHDSQSQAAVDLRVGLNGLLREHVTTNLSTNRSIVSDAPQKQIDAGMKAEMANTEGLAKAVGSIYGKEAQAQFLTLFNEHIVESNAIAQAVAAGDMDAKAEATVELEEYLGDITTFFSTAIPVLPYDAVYELLSEHEKLINESTEAFSKGDYEASYALEAKALVQVSTIADALASGIVTTQPDKF